MAANRMQGSTKGFRLALVQLAVGTSKPDNLTRAARAIADAAKNGAQIVALPECTNSPYGNEYFAEYAESIPGTSTTNYAQAAKDNNVFLVAGSIPERDGDKLYNTCTVFNPDGNLIAKFRKMHLFDIDIPGKITFQESKTLSPGDTLATFDTPYCKVGLGICYDMRFQEMSAVYKKRGCQLLIYPGAFNMTTGPAHWELLTRARALDNQLYFAVVGPARDTSATYVAWGHSTVADPWGKVIAKADETEQTIYADIDIDYVEQVRGQIPLIKQRRTDVYDIVDHNK